MATATDYGIKVDPEFSALIPPLSDEEFAQLEANILKDGCRDPLTVWIGQGILLDGHNRLKICETHGLEFDRTEIELASRDAAADWIDANQLGRRNLTPDQMSLLRGRRYNRAKKPQGGTGSNQYTEQSGQNVRSAKTANTLAAQHNVDERTIRRDGAFAAAVEKTKSIDPDIEKKVTSGKAPPKSAVIQAAKLLDTDPARAEEIIQKKKTVADVKREIRREEVKAKLADVAAREVEAPTGEFDVIVIDPPWPMKKIDRDERPNQTDFDYPTMDEDELAEMIVPCADDCHVWLWTTHKFIPMALRLLEAWKLKYVCTFVWHKPGGFQPIGLPQYNCEFALYARRGSPKFIDTKAFPVCFDAPRGEHSEKPEEFYDVLRRVTGGRRLDMFNRREIDGFKGWGKES